MRNRSAGTVQLVGFTLAAGLLLGSCGSDTKASSTVAATTETAVAAEQTTQPPAAPSATWPVLTVGSNSAKVRVLQYLLLANKITVSTDGKFGPKTGAAMAEFAKQKGLPASTSTTPQLWEALATPVTTSSPGSAVRALQVALADKGYKVTTSGVLDKDTAAGIAQLRADSASTLTGDVALGDWMALLAEPAA
jgi:peptidoglycan hydrolase-like protein with peptidoglycan-binding domain